ncbi:hypothetical protein TTHERM_00548150 (macronuclear) [Tetrahymena thermophila SB210]|uniref:Uncharacterized protein n=1 Tax=Tetrahymena thermophila (strain SB210) TaxID=312017 RepID=I7MDA4_TETTS|nr:hypothetical protein TTHERM_00548150 [Tetrahymena thermophila SB210]EAR86076.1 hypothetical protein TTHERM_00548150 [Tetrahymena thermophila SB210]|eukprot:XP_976671.1 hypothetical protein TTHERM_00548150 [Tetrahymena thermophila SB210]
MKLCKEDFEDEESYQKMRALRRAIRKMNKERKTQKEQRMVSYKSIRVQDVQLYFNLDFTQKLFMFYGDFFVMTDYNQTPHDIAEQISFFKDIKYVLSAEKIDKKQIVFLNVVTKDTIMHTPIEVLQKVIQNKPGDQLLQQFWPHIQQYYTNLEIRKSLVCYLNSIYTEDQLMQIKQLRNEYFDKKILEYIDQNFSQLDFYIYYKYSQAGLNDHYLQFTKIGISYSLIALLGSDPDMFINISMRNGFMEFSSKSDKQKSIYQSLICSLLVNQAKSLKCGNEKTTLLTFDEYEINTVINCICFTCDYPPHLNIEVNGNNFTTEVCHFMNYEIDENIIQSIIAKRTKNPQFMQQWENEEFGYTMESQVFLEKYYNQLLQNKITQIEQKYVHENKYYYNKQCNYKQIQNENLIQNELDNSSKLLHFRNNVCQN